MGFSLQDGANIATIAQTLLAYAVAIGGGAFLADYIIKMRPVWKRFTKNLKRQLVVISTEDQSMDHEAELLDNVGFFKKTKLVAPDIRNITLLEGSALLVVGYSPNSKMYQASFDYAKTNRLPFIVYSRKHELDEADETALMDYSYSSLCRTDLRLVSDVFAAVSTFPGVKK